MILQHLGHVQITIGDEEKDAEDYISYIRSFVGIHFLSFHVNQKILMSSYKRFDFNFVVEFSGAFRRFDKTV